MSRKVTEYEPGKMTASKSRRGRVAAVLGVLSAMVRGSRARRIPRVADGFTVPQGARMGPPLGLAVQAGDLSLVR
ncbi:MAG: hypothetical protein ACE5JE_01690 [Thermoplasmata archaeon]